MKQITIEQRYQTEAYLKLKQLKDFIAKELNLHRSTVFREIRRNKNKNGKYSAKLAQEYSFDRKDRFTANRRFTEECQKFIDDHLKKYWSPKQIMGYCKKNKIDMVSHERIYQYIREDKENGGNLYQYTRHRLKHRNRPVGKHYPIANRVSIEESQKQ